MHVTGATKLNKTACHGSQSFFNESGLQCDEARDNNVDYAIHSYRRQGGRGGRGGGGGGGGNINNHVPTSRKSHAPWLVCPCLLNASFFAYVTFACLLL